jgi:hypothetical protein
MVTRETGYDERYSSRISASTEWEVLLQHQTGHVGPVTSVRNLAGRFVDSTGVVSQILGEARSAMKCAHAAQSRTIHAIPEHNLNLPRQAYVDRQLGAVFHLRLPNQQSRIGLHSKTICQGLVQLIAPTNMLGVPKPGGLRLEVISTSSGYEAWSLHVKEGQFIARNGDRVFFPSAKPT